MLQGLCLQQGAAQTHSPDASAVPEASLGVLPDIVTDTQDLNVVIKVACKLTLTGSPFFNNLRLHMLPAFRKSGLVASSLTAQTTQAQTATTTTSGTVSMLTCTYM